MLLSVALEEYRAHCLTHYHFPYYPCWLLWSFYIVLALEGQACLPEDDSLYFIHILHVCFRSNCCYLSSSQYRLYHVNKYTRQTEGHIIYKQNNGGAFLRFICGKCFYFPSSLFFFSLFLLCLWSRPLVFPF